MKHFGPQEFPDPIAQAHPDLLLSLDALREYVGVPVIPSPVTGALARTDGSPKSMHYAGGDRLSKACDVFIDAPKFEVFTKVIKSDLFTGIGFYFDTYYKGILWMMLHLDLRLTPLMWYRDKDYYYNKGTIGSKENNFYKNIHRYLK